MLTVHKPNSGSISPEHVVTLSTVCGVFNIHAVVAWLRLLIVVQFFMIVANCPLFSWTRAQLNESAAYKQHMHRLQLLTY